MNPNATARYGTARGTSDLGGKPFGILSCKILVQWLKLSASVSSSGREGYHRNIILLEHLGLGSATHDRKPQIIMA